MSEEEYSLKKSTEKIGQLYPILVAKDGEIIDGYHRAKSDKTWKKEVIEEIDTEEKKILARAISNWHRRAISREEKEEWINRLAEIYIKQGIKRGAILKEISQAIGLDVSTIRQYIDEQYKGVARTKGISIPKVSASEAIISKAGGWDKGYGERLVERHREEVKEELLQDPKFVAEALEVQRQIAREEMKLEADTGVACKIVTVGEDKEIAFESFEDKYPNCMCKGCPHYQDCGGGIL